MIHMFTERIIMDKMLKKLRKCVREEVMNMEIAFGMIDENGCRS